MYPSPFALGLKRPWPAGLPSLYGGRDDGLTSSLMWLRDRANPGFQSLNFSGLGMSPWMQPRLDNSFLGLQSDMYQTVAAAALQGTTKQVPPSAMQFQQPQNIADRSALLSSQILQQVHPRFQQIYPQNLNENKIQVHTQTEYLQQQLQRCHSFNEQKPPLHPQQQQQEPQQHQQCVQAPQDQQMQQQKHLHSFHSLPDALSAFSQLSSATHSPPSALQTVPAFSHQQNFPDTNISSLSPSSGSSMHGMLGRLPSEAAASSLPCVVINTPVSVSDPWSSKRVAVESVNPSRPHVSPQIEQLDMAPCNMPQSSALAPLPGRECSVDQDGCSDPQNQLLFGVHIDSHSLLMQGGIPALQNDNSPGTIPYPTSNFLSPSENDFPLNQQPLRSAGCLDEPDYLPCAENSGQANQQFATFVKVYKSGTVGRLLDITRFSSYDELRSAVGRLFGLEGQLEDPLRSGWQLVFVDREDDVLLVGDDPWQEFVNSVSCIKILSPEEVQRMGKPGIQLLSSAPSRRLGNGCDRYRSVQEPRGLGAGMAPVGSVEF